MELEKKRTIIKEEKGWSEKRHRPDREGVRESSGRKRVVHGVDVIGVRSASEAAENQSFCRTTDRACFRTEDR